jgi:hypothetical protein
MHCAAAGAKQQESSTNGIDISGCICHHMKIEAQQLDKHRATKSAVPHLLLHLSLDRRQESIVTGVPARTTQQQQQQPLGHKQAVK